MASGDTKSDIQSVATGAYLDIRPAVGEEWTIHNIFHEDMVELYFYDGTDLLKFDDDTVGGWWAKHALHVTNGIYVRVKNIHASGKLVGYSGKQTK